MKLVGATNWFVRAPFMLEGLLCGLAGSILAVILLLLAKELALPGIMGRIESPGDIQAWSFPVVALILVGMSLLVGAAGPVSPCGVFCESERAVHVRVPDQASESGR